LIRRPNGLGNSHPSPGTIGAITKLRRDVTDGQMILLGVVKIELMNLAENYLLFSKDSVLNFQNLLNNSKIYYLTKNSHFS